MTEKVLHIIKGDVVDKSLLLAYINGSLDDAEMKRVALLVDADPFLKDAVEGLKSADSQTVAATLDAIYHDVDVIVGNKKSFTLSSTLKKYAAAAMILVFFGLTFLIMNQLNEGAKTDKEIALSPEINTVTGNDDTSDMGSGALETETVNTHNEKNTTATVTSEPAVTPMFIESKIYEEDLKESMDDIEPSISINPNSGTLANTTTDKALYNVTTTAPTELNVVTYDTYSPATKDVSVVAQTTEKKSGKLDNKADKPKKIDAAKAETATDAGASLDYALWEDSIYQFVEVLPEFTGGQLALIDYLAKNINYALVGEATGIVYVKFIVNIDGSIENAKVVRGITAEADAEALRVVNAMPKWSPGLIAGKPVRTEMTIPIKFIR